MRKITFLLLLNLSFVANAQTFNFDTNEDSEGWVGKNGSISVDSGIMTLTPANHKNPNIQYANGIDADANGYVHLKLKNNSSIANEIRFVIKNAVGDGDTFINTNITTRDTDFKTYDLELSGADGWSGTVNAITMRFTERSTVLDGTADNTDIDYIIFDNKVTLKTESLEKFKFSFYPNPTQDKVILSATETVEQVQIYNLIGQEVLNVKLGNQIKQEINIASLSTGVYNMKVIIGDIIGVVKIIKN
tara:strand:+ start:19168 stop:19908 length:741 start_codon:yes stop_codon:yes gene_type:complete